MQEDLDAGRMELIMVSVRRDSVLHDRAESGLEKKRTEKQRNAAIKQ